MTLTEALICLKAKSSSQYHDGMARFGIDSSRALGVKVPDIRKLAKMIKKDHILAMELWESNIHEARLLATMVADPAEVTPEMMDKWTDDFYSWDICDQACGNLFDKTPFAVDKAFEYSQSEHEFVKRCGFVLMAEYAVHDKKASDDIFLSFLPVIAREAWDDRNFVKKAVNWSLCQIGKRNTLLKHAAIACAQQILNHDTKAAKWIAQNALKELLKRY